MKDNFSDIIIRPMTESDLEEVLAIENDSFLHPWTRDFFRDEINFVYSFPLVAFDRDGRVIGYISPRLFLDEGHILNIAVHRDFRGTGVARFLLERVLSDCRRCGAVHVFLEVRVSNKAAISLYRRMGFVEKGRRRRYYENVEDAIMMEFNFAGNGVDYAV